MDARIIKSKKKIFDAFVELRRKKELRKITVKELCRIAQINKSTFYAHYEDVFDLSDNVENALVAEALSKINNLDNIISDSCEFTRQIFKVLSMQDEKLRIVFSGTQQPNFVDKLSKLLKEIIFNKYPEFEGDQRFSVLLDYTIFGGYYAYEASHKSSFNSESVINILTKANGHMYKLLGIC